MLSTATAKVPVSVTGSPASWALRGTLGADQELVTRFFACRYAYAAGGVALRVEVEQQGPALGDGQAGSQGHGRLAQGFRARHQLRDAAQAVEQGVFGMAVEMDEGHVLRPRGWATPMSWMWRL